ncbi:MAG: hypothetical protein AAFV49_24055, partial [Pseudomonadota bacterium]
MTAARSSGPEAVLAAARGWLGTPYRHQASCRGVGADCLGLVRGVWREVLGAEPCTVPAYTPDWAEAGAEPGAPERMLEAAGRWLLPVAGAARPGDVLLFRMRAKGPVKHAAILAAGAPPEGRMIH